MRLCLTHPDMRESYINPFWIPLVMLGYWLSPDKSNYGMFLISLDFVVVFVSTIYMLIIKPLIYTGILPAYYPKEYSPKVMYFSLFYGLFAATAYGRLIPHMRHISFLNINNHTHPYAILAYIVSLTLFVLLYYGTWYVTIKRFDKGVRTIMFAPSDRFGDYSNDAKGASYLFLRDYERYKKKHGSLFKRRKMKKMKESIPDIENDDILNDMFSVEVDKTRKVREAEIREREIKEHQEISKRRRNRGEV